MDEPKYKRVLLKISGEALAGDKHFGLDFQVMGRVADVIKECVAMGVQVGVVIGGGNFWRGVKNGEGHIERTRADHMGMLATAMNCMAMADVLEQKGVDVRVQTALEIKEVAEPYIRARAVRHLEKGRVVIFGCGVGCPFFSTDTAAVRAGRANASVLNRIHVDYYGTPTPIQQIASVGSPDPRTLVITPWDASALKAIEKAILESDLGINPQNDGKAIRLSFPQLTEERRKDLVKQIRKYTEGGKVAVRNIRRDAMENFKKQQKASEITEDELKMAEKDLQKLTDDSCKELDKLLENKEKELLSV